jgi:uncharacterized protein
LREETDMWRPTDAESARRAYGRQGAAASAASPIDRLLLCLLLLLWIPFAARAEVAVPPLRSPVTDLTQTLTGAEAAALEQKLRAFEARKGSQVGVLLVPTTAPETIEQYAIRVAETWKLGRRSVEDGVLLVVAKEDHTVRIEVGTGLEGALPDVIANRITDQVMVPRFRDGRFAEGINEGVDRIIAVLDGEPLPAPERRAHSGQRRGEGVGTLLPLMLMLVFVGSGIARQVFGGIGGASAMAGVAGVIAWALTSIIGVAVGAGLIAFLFTLMGGGGGGGGGWTSGRRGGWGSGMGGGGFGGFGGGGGGGGWSGGGGGFSGGGASGRW